jgi:hypothetical protein
VEALLIIGILCLASAVVGGGIKMAGAEFPVLTSRTSRVMLSIVGMLALGAALFLYFQKTGSTNTTPAPSQSRSIPASKASSPASPPQTSSTAATKFLRELSPVVNSVDKGVWKIGGVSYADSISLPFGNCRRKQVVEYNLGREWQKLHATVGLSEDSASDSMMRFSAYVDNTPVFTSENLSYMVLQVIDVRVADGLRLRLELQEMAGDNNLSGWCDSNGGRAIWGSASLTK